MVLLSTYVTLAYNAIQIQTIVVSMSALKAGTVIVGWMAESIPNLVCQVT